MAARFTIQRVTTHITASQNDRLRREVRAIIDKDYGGSISAFANKIGRSQPTISDFLNGKSGASWQTVLLIARWHRRTPESLVGKPDDSPPQQNERDVAIDAAKRLNYHADAIARVLADFGDGNEDKDRQWWIAQIQTAQAQLFAEMRARSPLGKKPPKKREESRPAARPAAQPAETHPPKSKRVANE